MVPMNLLGAGATADYIDSGSWADKAIKEAKKVGDRQRRGDDEGRATTRAFREQRELKLTPGAAYVHMTSNNTIEGTAVQAAARRRATRRSSATPRRTCSAARSTSRATRSFTPARRRTWDRPASRSSSFATICWQRSAEQKAIAADDAELRGACGERLAVQHAAGLRDLRARPRHEVAASRRAGSRRSAAVNERKAAKLYAEIDRTGFYRGTAQTGSRSLMNVTFRLATEELEKLFVKESTAAGLDGLKGHRAVGGHARVDLQRVSRGRRRRARRRSCATSSARHG